MVISGENFKSIFFHPKKLPECHTCRRLHKFQVRRCLQLRTNKKVKICQGLFFTEFTSIFIVARKEGRTAIDK